MKSPTEIPVPGRLIDKPWQRLYSDTTFKTQWPDAKAALVAFRTGQGRTSSAIAAELADGTLPETIRAMWKKWGIKAATVTVPLSEASKALLAKRAAAEGITPDQWAANVLSAAATHDLFDAIVPDNHPCKNSGRRKRS